MAGTRPRRSRWMYLMLGVLPGLVVLPALGADSPPAAIPGLPTDALDQVIHDYLLRHPEAVAEALQRFESRQQEAEAARVRAAIQDRQAELLRGPASPVGGNPAGQKTMVEFFDYRCPHCRHAAPTVAQAVRQDPNLRIVYKELPILGPASVVAARAALASSRQGKYVPFHDALMAEQGELSEERILTIASVVGLDLERLRQEMADPGIQALIERNYALAEAIGVQATPSFVIGERLVRGAVDLPALTAAIAEAFPPPRAEAEAQR
jgi:protein-disulfide isomerase